MQELAVISSVYMNIYSVIVCIFILLPTIIYYIHNHYIFIYIRY